jgi:hypothetical protein
LDFLELQILAILAALTCWMTIELGGRLCNRPIGATEIGREELSEHNLDW